MTSGFKIGLADWQEKLESCKKFTGSYPKFVEIYFRVDKIPEYSQMFLFLEKNNIESGLHFWGVLKSGIEPNLLSKQKWIQNQSVMLMQSVIKVAAIHKCVYVNVHPGALKERVLDLDKSEFQLAKFPETDFKEARKNLMENALRLKKIAEKYQVLFTYETLPTNSPIKWLLSREKSNVLIAKQCPIEFYEDLVKNGYFVANDFGHTATSIVVGAGLRPAQSSQPLVGSDRSSDLSLRENDRDVVLRHLSDWTQKLSSQTKLIHCNLTLPPFDGVDTHLGLGKDDFAKNTLPNKEELIKLLRIFKDRDDVFILNEPESNHVENYMELLNILRQL